MDIVLFLCSPLQECHANQEQINGSKRWVLGCAKSIVWQTKSRSKQAIFWSEGNLHVMTRVAEADDPGRNPRKPVQRSISRSRICGMDNAYCRLNLYQKTSWALLATPMPQSLKGATNVLNNPAKEKDPHSRLQQHTQTRSLPFPDEQAGRGWAQNRRRPLAWSWWLIFSAP